MISKNYIIIYIYLFFSFFIIQCYSSEYKSFSEIDINSLKEISYYIKKNPRQYLPYVTFSETLFEKYEKNKVEKELQKYFKKSSFQYKFILSRYFRAYGEIEKSKEVINSISKIPSSALILSYLIVFQPSKFKFFKNKIEKPNEIDDNISKLLENIALNKRYKDQNKDLNNVVENFNNYNFPDNKIFIASIFFYYLNEYSNNSVEKTLEFYKNYIENKDYFKNHKEYKIYVNSSLYHITKSDKLIVEAINISRNYRFYNKLCSFYSLQAKKFGMNGEYNKVIEIYKRNVCFYKNREKKFKLGYTYFYIGDVYMVIGASNEAIKYYRKSELILKKLNSEYYSTILFKIGSAYLDNGKIDRALDYALKNINESKKNKFKKQIYSSYYLYARCLLKKDNVKEALKIGNDYYKDSIKFNNKDGEQMFLSILIDSNIKLKNYCKAMAFIRKKLTFTLLETEKIDLYMQMFEIYKHTNCSKWKPQFLSVFERRKIIYKVKNIIKNVKYKDIKSKDAKIEFLEMARKVDDYCNKNDDEVNKLYINSLLYLLSLILFLFALYFLISYYKKRNQSLIGAYRIKEKVGKGGMGTVYKAISIEDKKSVALKVMNEELVTSENKIQRFRREGEILKGLKHSNILEFYDIGEYKGKVYFASEFINGKNLSEIVKEKWPLPLEQCLFICREILKGLIYLHGNRIIHRDIKLSNIMCSENTKLSTITQINAAEKQVVKIMDFGLAKDLDMTKMTKADTIMGTPAYLSPETILMGVSNESTDIYSFGVLMYELFAGIIPFQHPEPASVMYQIINTTPKQPIEIFENIPKEINNIIMKCIEKKPENRYGSAKELLEKLNKY